MLHQTSLTSSKSFLSNGLNISQYYNKDSSNLIRFSNNIATSLFPVVTIFPETYKAKQNTVPSYLFTTHLTALHRSNVIRLSLHESVTKTLTVARL